MFIPTSSEFVELCRAQIALLTQGLGASLSVVYLTQELVEGGETPLVPVAAYPEAAADWPGRSPLQFPPAMMTSREVTTDQPPRLLRDSTTPLIEDRREMLEPFNPDELELPALPSNRADLPYRGSLVPQRRLVLPLIHQEVVMGLLVTERSDRAWNEWEQAQIHEIATTLALACVLDQRYQWLEQDRRQQQLLQTQQHDILDNLLHQFRNSLTALQTFSKLILRRLLPGDANREIAASIAREAARLKELSQQLETAATGMEKAQTSPLFLPPAVGEWGKDRSLVADSKEREIRLLPDAGVLAGAPLSLQPCSVVEVLQPLLASAGAIAQERNLTLYTVLPSNLPLVVANEQALREVFNNLIENALKYTASGGQVFVQARPLILEGTAENESWLEVSISDTGPGISSQDLPHIFERRFRGAQAESDIPGSGLGLAIARALVEQMHGKIQVISPAQTSYSTQSQSIQAIGPGATFTVHLPIAKESVS